MTALPKPRPLQQKKQDLVRAELWNAAVDLFAERGYEGTTVEDIAQAAGVSRRTFFRYFASKDDVMVQATDAYGDLLVAAVRESAGAAPLAIVEHAVRRLAAWVVIQPRVRAMMDIVQRSPAARAAQLSENAAITSRVAAAFATLVPSSGPHAPALLASLTFLLLDETFRTWYATPGDTNAIVDDVLASMQALTQAGSSGSRASSGRRPAANPSRRGATTGAR